MKLAPAIASGLFLLTGGCGDPCDGPATILGDLSYYLDRPEAEQQFRGIVRYEPHLISPNGNGPFRLDADTWIKNPGTRKERLQDFAGRFVEIVGKLVTSAPLGPEIWAANIRCATATAGGP